MNYIEYTFSLFKKPEKEPSKFDKLLGAVNDMAAQRAATERDVLTSGDKHAIQQYYKNKSLSNKAKEWGKTYKSLRRNIFGTTAWDRDHYNLMTQGEKAKLKAGLKNNKWRKRNELLVKTNKELVKALKAKNL